MPYVCQDRGRVPLFAGMHEVPQFMHTPLLKFMGHKTTGVHARELLPIEGEEVVRVSYNFLATRVLRYTPAT